MPAPDEWTLTYPGAMGYPGATFTWGTYASGVMHGAPPDLGDIEVLDDDQDRPRADGRAFGVDYRGAATVTFEMLLLGADETVVRDRYEQLATVWRADAVRRVPGAVAELHRNVAGRERVAYGRPRRFAPGDKYTHLGVTGVVADFACVDDCWYSPDEHVESLGIVPPAGGGLTGVLAAPLTTTATSDRSTAITVGGVLGAWPVMTIQGPITNPTVEVVGLWQLQLATSLAFDQQVVIDTRPWRRTVLRNGVASLAGALTRTSARLADTVLPPGQYEVVLRGVDQTGTASLRFAWRETYPSL